MNMEKIPASKPETGGARESQLRAERILEMVREMGRGRRETIEQTINAAGYNPEVLSDPGIVGMFEPQEGKNLIQALDEIRYSPRDVVKKITQDRILPLLGA